MSEAVPASSVKTTVSSPSGSVQVDSLDAKIIQYQYALAKLRPLLASLKKLTTVQDLPLIHYIILLAGNLFAINEAPFIARLKILAAYKLFKPQPITISSVVTHVPYDNQDVPVVPLEDLPSVESGVRCLKQLDYVVSNCIHGYLKRLALARTQRDNDTLVTDLDALVQTCVFSGDIDLGLGIGSDPGECPFLFSLPGNTSDGTVVEATLIDMDIKTLFSITKGIDASLQFLRPQIGQLKDLKLVPKPRQQAAFAKLPHNAYTLHKVLMWIFRLNDLYLVLRAFGRKIYLSNYQHLYDQKFLTISKLSNYFRSQLLREVDDLFNTTKKNGILIANLTRFIRANSVHENNLKNVLDFSNFLTQALALVDASNKKFREFGVNWVLAEITFRNAYNLPVAVLNRIEGEVRPSPPSAKPRTLEPPQVAASLRTSSLSSSSSVTLMRRTSVSTLSPRRNSLLGPPPQAKLTPMRRPNSMVFLGLSDSLNTFVDADSTPTKPQPAPDTPPTTRRRSNSQPVASTAKLVTGAAATALKGQLSPTASIRSTRSLPIARSPSGSIKRSASNASSPPPKPLIALEESEEEPVAKPKLSANERLQLHLRQAAKSGALMTQHKEVLHRVVFDPNDPSATHLRKEVPKEAKEASPEPLPLPLPLPLPRKEPKPEGPPKPQTRAQVTKLNTMRNSAVIRVEPESTLASTASSSDSEVVKKVRFTGVPEYTPEEDAPAKYANKILRNFAVFRAPVRPALKKKDQQLKKEESLLFKKEVQSPIGLGHAPVPATLVSEPATLRQNKLSRLKNKFV